MKIKAITDIKNNIYYRDIVCTGLGTASLTEEEEKAQLDNFPTYLIYKDLIWTKKVNIDSEGNVVEDKTVGDSATGVEVTISLINKKVLLDEKFNAHFEIAVKDISDSKLDSNILTTKERYCEACTLVFELVIKEAIKNILENIRLKSNDYEKDNEEIL